MNNDVLVLAEVAGDSFIDATFELLGRARELATAWGGRVLVLILGPSPDPTALDANVVLTMAHPKLDERQVLMAVLDQDRHLLAARPGLLLIADKGYASAELDSYLDHHGVEYVNAASQALMDHAERWIILVDCHESIRIGASWRDVNRPRGFSTGFAASLIAPVGVRVAVS